MPVVIPTLETVGDRRQSRPPDSVLGPAGGYANTRVRSDHCATMLQREDYRPKQSSVLIVRQFDDEYSGESRRFPSAG